MAKALFTVILLVGSVVHADWLSQLEGSHLDAAYEMILRDISGLEFTIDEASDKISFNEGKAVEPKNYDQPAYDYAFTVEVDFPPYQLKGVCRIVYDSFQMPVAIFNKDQSKCEEFENIIDEL